MSNKTNDIWSENQKELEEERSKKSTMTEDEYREQKEISEENCRVAHEDSYLYSDR